MADKSIAYINISDPTTTYFYSISDNRWKKMKGTASTVVLETEIDRLLAKKEIKPMTGSGGGSTTNGSSSSGSSSGEKCGFFCKAKKAGKSIKTKATDAGKKTKEFGHKVKTANDNARKKLETATAKAKVKTKKVFDLEKEDPRAHDPYPFGEPEEIDEEVYDRRPTRDHSRSRREDLDRRPAKSHDRSMDEDYDRRPTRDRFPRDSDRRVKPKSNGSPRSQPRTTSEPKRDSRNPRYYVRNDSQNVEPAQSLKSARAKAYRGAKNSRGKSPDARTFVVLDTNGFPVGAVTKLNDGLMVYCKLSEPHNLYYVLKSDGTLGKSIVPGSY